MNRVFRVHIDGHIFETDENAYHMLKRMLSMYRTKLKFTDMSYQDLEASLAKFLLKLQGSNEDYVVSSQDIIASREYIDEEIRRCYTGDRNKNTAQRPMYKKLYRDTEDRVIGGVIAGIGHYLSVEVVWLRIFAVVIACVSFGTAVICYFILWIIVPKANTEYRRARMYGIFSDYDDFKSKVREEFGAARDKMDGFSIGNFFSSIWESIESFFRRFYRPRTTSRL